MAKLRSGVIGLRMGRAHVDAYAKHPDAEVTAVCDADPERLDEVGKAYGVGFKTDDFRELVSREDVDVVNVVVPDHFHAEVALAALEAGKAVLCEKPMAPTADECRRMVAASEAAGLPLMIGQSYRFNPRYVAVKDLVEAGELGEVYFVESSYWNNLRGVGGIGNWRNDPAIRHPFVGGCHAADLTRWICGDVVELTAASNHIAFPEQPTDDMIVAQFRFASGALGRALVSSGCERPFLTTLDVHGTKASVEDWRLHRGKKDAEGAPVPPAGTYSHIEGEIDAFVRAVLSRTPVPCDAREGAKSTLVALAVVEACRTGRPVAFDNDKLEWRAL